MHPEDKPLSPEEIQIAKLRGAVTELIDELKKRELTILALKNSLLERDAAAVVKELQTKYGPLLND